MSLSAKDQQTAAIATATIPADPSGARKIQGKTVAWSYSAAPTGGNLKVKNGATILLEVDITAAGPGSIDISELVADREESMSAVLASGAGAVVGNVCISGKYV